ncbi:USP domain-containing protein [Plasmodiophora brassicae]|nr:hypothetical protein PBRA_004214 [Plasmodiophora brassicae]
MGNTCFMASQLQALGCISEIVDYFASRRFESDINPRSPSRGTLVDAFGSLMTRFRDGPDGAVVRPTDVKDAIGTICTRFRGYAQQDSQEFLRTLLSGMHDDLNRIRTKPAYTEITELPNDSDDDLAMRWWQNYTDRNLSFLSTLFCGQLKSSVVCGSCSYVSRTFDPFWDLSLQIKRTATRSCTLLDCFTVFTKDEVFSGYYCSKCKKHVDARRRLSLHRLPTVLVIHLKRFEYSSSFPTKLNDIVDFPLQDLSLESFYSGSGAPAVYDLVAVSNHYGNISGGHYTAFGKVAPNAWAEFNDSRASTITLSSVKSPAAYVLFFKRR